MTEMELIEKFDCDLNQISQYLVNNFNLKHKQEVQPLVEPLLRWADFRLRYIDPRSRKILPSDKFPSCIHPAAKSGFEKFMSEVISGADLNIYQSEGLSRFDVSGKKPQCRTDLLWADWGILHFHLTTSPPAANKYYSPRSKWLLFAIVTSNEFGLIDIRHHKEKDIFEKKDLIEVAVKCWPDYFSEYKVNGILPPENSSFSEDLKKLRKAGITLPIVVDGVLYAPPGGGITTASIGMKAIVKADQIKKIVRQLAKFVVNPNGSIQRALIGKAINSPKFSLNLTPRGLGVFEERSKVCFLFPSDNQDIHFLQDFLAPEWVCSRLSDNVADLG